MDGNNTATRLPVEDWRAFRGVLSRRVLGFLVDYLIVGTIGTVLGLIITVFTLGLGFFVWAFIYPLVAIIYFGRTMGGPAQASPGMRMAGLRLVRLDGKTIDFPTAVIHLVLFWAGNAILTPLIVLVGLFTDRSRLLHDLLMGTAMMRTDSI